MPSAPQKRAWANGRSLDTLITVVFSRPAASSLNLRTLAAQMPVSTDGKMLRTVRPVASAAVSEERSEEHTSELQSLMRISYAVFCLKKHIVTHCQAHIP